MYSTCLHCTRDLGRNDVIETLPIGRRIAFDAADGRLWVVCQACAKWNLVPFDTRLETIDACERLYRETRQRYSTREIGIGRVRGGLEVVRIGRPLRPEFAAWRYGSQYRRRRRKTLLLSGGAAGVLVGAAVAVVLAVSTIAGDVIAGFESFGDLRRGSYRAVRNARRRVRVALPEEPAPIVLKADELDLVRFHYNGDQVSLALHGDWHTQLVRGPEAPLVARRVLAALNDDVGSQRHVDDALEFLELPGPATGFDPRRAVNRTILASDGSFTLSEAEAAARLAIEMWLGEADEARALTGELKLLERQWQEAEELARIADALTVSDEVHARVDGT